MINLSPETEAAAKRLAVARGLSLEEAIRLALEEQGRAADKVGGMRPPRDTSRQAVAARRQRTRRFVAELAAMPVLDPRPANEIAEDSQCAMIVVDSSALIAIFFRESEDEAFQGEIDADERCAISAVNAHETACVLRGKPGAAAVSGFWRWLEDNAVEVIAFDEVQVRAAAVAFDRYGKGIDPRARLNLADCAAYALAKSLDGPLLFKGDDFARTDIRRASSQVGPPGIPS